jgi:hypothetical protein
LCALPSPFQILDPDFNFGVLRHLTSTRGFALFACPFNMTPGQLLFYDLFQCLFPFLALFLSAFFAHCVFRCEKCVFPIRTSDNRSYFSVRSFKLTLVALLVTSYEPLLQFFFEFTAITRVSTCHDTVDGGLWYVFEHPSINNGMTSDQLASYLLAFLPLAMYLLLFPFGLYLMIRRTQKKGLLGASSSDSSSSAAPVKLTGQPLLSHLQPKFNSTSSNAPPYLSLHNDDDSNNSNVNNTQSNIDDKYSSSSSVSSTDSLKSPELSAMKSPDWNPHDNLMNQPRPSVVYTLLTSPFSDKYASSFLFFGSLFFFCRFVPLHSFLSHRSFWLYVL